MITLPETNRSVKAVLFIYCCKGVSAGYCFLVKRIFAPAAHENTALVIAGVISCTSPMMVMASDSGSVMSQAEEILKDNEVGSLASDPDKVGDIIVYVKGLFDSNQITDDEISQGIDEAADHFGSHNN